jgi:glutamine amidotransferase
MTVTVVDYGRGNLFSISQALRFLGYDINVSADPAEITRSARIILPGVGAFGDCMNGLVSRGLDRAVKLAASHEIPILGICVGAQVMLDIGEEFGRQEGLGLVPGSARRLPESNGGPDSIRIPNVGWRQLQSRSSVFEDVPESAMVYFVHSYAPFVDDARDIAATISINGIEAPVAFRRGNILGFQFHPEKSGPVGLRLIDKFMHLST